MTKIQCLLLELLFVEVLSILYPLRYEYESMCVCVEVLSSHIGFPLPHTLLHSSMRHRRFFDIIKLMCRPAIGLQTKPSFTYFEGWV